MDALLETGTAGSGTAGMDAEYCIAEWAVLGDATYMLPALADLGVSLNDYTVCGLVLTVIMQVRSFCLTCHLRCL